MTTIIRCTGNEGERYLFWYKTSLDGVTSFFIGFLLFIYSLSSMWISDLQDHVDFFFVLHKLTETNELSLVQCLAAAQFQ